MARHRRFLQLGLVLAPILALAACDQVNEIWKQIQGGQATQEAGPVDVAAVPVDARTMGGALWSPEEGAEFTVVQPAAFVPGEIIIGAKVEAAVAEAAGLSLANLQNRLASAEAPGLDALGLAPGLVEKATTEAVDDAQKATATVLRRLGVDGEVEVGAGGVITIDLTPDKASPTAFQTPDGAAPAPGGTAAPAAAPAAPEAAPTDPEVITETGARCPRGLTGDALEQDPAALTQCALERLRASKQFEFVEKNYVFTTGFELPFPRSKPAPAPAPTNGSGQPAPTNGGATNPGAPPVAPGQQTFAGQPNDPLLPYQWHFRGRGAGQGMSQGGAGFEPFWAGFRQVGTRAVRVAVIDTGIDRAHPDVATNPNIAAGINLISDPERAGNTEGVSADPNDFGDGCRGRPNSYHGTHVAGTIGAALTNDRTGVVSGAWNVTVVPVRALGKCGGELTDIINAIRWAAGIAPATTGTGQQVVNANPADIINMSLSVPLPCPESMQDAIDQATSRGAVIVVAAGNKSNPASNFAPANCRNVVVVGAADAMGAMSFFSNFGPEVTIMAPGGDMLQDADQDGRPDGVLSTATLRTDCYDPVTRQAADTCYYSYQHGTSMAAPHVSAALALIKSQYNLSGRALTDFMLQRAVTPIESAKCEIACDRNPNATPIPGRPGMCMRPCGRGALDLGRLVGVQPAAAPTTPG